MSRADPNGLLVRFNITAMEPIVRMRFQLVGDGEPPQEIAVVSGVDFLYSRGWIWKPVRNGLYPLKVEAWTKSGVQGSTTCSPGVTVTL